ncbi:MAG: hypothetical protein WA954_00055 [Parerythrobacter sp.]
MKKILISAAAVSMVLAPVAVTAAPAIERSVAVAQQEDELAGSGIILGILAAAAIIAGILLIASDDDDDDVPISA